jgi:hypothetical protein
MPGAPRTYCGILSYCLQHPGRPVDVRTLSTVIGESAQKVTQVCEALVQAGVLVKFGSDDAPRPFFQLGLAAAAVRKPTVRTRRGFSPVSAQHPGSSIGACCALLRSKKYVPFGITWA